MSVLRSKVGIGFTTHTRFTPVKRTFKYNLSYLLIDLFNESDVESVPLLSLKSSLFFSCKPDKYLLPGKTRFKEKLIDFLAYAKSDLKFNKALLLTSPAFFSISFNPVSFFYLYQNDLIVGIIAEVHNTYKEKHMYLLTDPIQKNDYIEFNYEKLLHVSPFFKVEGKYNFLFSIKPDIIEVIINYKKGSKLMLNAMLKLSTHPISKGSFFKLFFNFISTSFTTFPRILFQAAILKFKFKLPHFKNTSFKSKQTFSRKGPSFFEKISMTIIDRFLKRIHIGHLTLHLPNQTSKYYGQDHSDLAVTITVNDYSFFTSLLLKSDLGLAESYMKNNWTTPNLSDVFKLFIKNNHLMKTTRSFSFFSKLIKLFQHKSRKNNIKNSKKNIFEHYDLGNDFFKLFLDDGMVYSSAMFKSPEQTLEDAQLDKINHILTLSDIKSRHHILEIGSGWGSLAIQAAKTIGCRVTTVTISEEQYKYVKQQINQEHLDHLIEVKLMDYRYLTGKYDRVISIEMLEAVGHEYIDTYFNKISSLLNPGGKAMFQCITIPEDRYDSYRKNPDFIQTYIFPGGHLPTIEFLKESCINQSFKWVKADDIGLHYGITLSHWEERFIESESQLNIMGFDQNFYFKWIYYFNYCKAGFESNFIHNYQFIIEK